MWASFLKLLRPAFILKFCAIHVVKSPGPAHQPTITQIWGRMVGSDALVAVGQCGLQYL